MPVDIPRQLPEMQVTIKQPGLVVARLASGPRKVYAARDDLAESEVPRGRRYDTIGPAVAGQVYPVPPAGLIFQSEPGLPIARIEALSEQFPWGGRAYVIRAPSDRLLVAHHGERKFPREEGHSFMSDFGNREQRKKVSFGRPSSIEVEWLGDMYREVIGNIMQRRERGEYGAADIIPLTEDSSVIATSPIVSTYLVNNFDGEKQGKIKIMLGMSLKGVGHNGHVRGDIFLARQRPGKAPDITWSMIKARSYLDGRSNDQRKTNIAEFMAFIDGLTPESVSTLGLNHNTLGPDTFIQDVSKYITDAYAESALWRSRLQWYSPALVNFPRSLDQNAVDNKRERLTGILQANTAQPGAPQ